MRAKGYIRPILNIETISNIMQDQSISEKQRLSQEICNKTSLCQKSSIIIALSEVQIRLRLDNRFFVASLDGITDYKIKNFFNENRCLNHFEYIKYRKINLLWEFHDYSPKELDCGFSLQDVELNMKKGKSIIIQDLLFEPVIIEGQVRAIVKHLNKET